MTEPLYALPAVAAYAAKVEVATLRKWHERGHITRHENGCYDLREVLAWVERRDTGKIRTTEST